MDESYGDCLNQLIIVLKNELVFDIDIDNFGFTS